MKTLWRNAAMIIALALGIIPFSAGAAQPALVCTQLNTTMRIGMTGGQVPKLQTFLSAKGYLESEFITGTFGGHTENSLQRFQRDNGVVTGGTPATTGFGITGPATRAKIEALSCTTATGAGLTTAKLKVTTVLINNGVGTLAPQNFPLFIGNQLVQTGLSTTLQPGTYTLRQTNQAGYRQLEWSGDCAANGTITLRAGDNKSCVITNDDIPGSNPTTPTTPTAGPTIQILTPNGGETVVRGRDYTIAWRTTGSIPNVDVIIRGTYIANNVPNSGSYTWRVPATYQLGNYKIKIAASSGNTPRPFDESNADFTIAQTATPPTTLPTTPVIPTPPPTTPTPPPTTPTTPTPPPTTPTTNNGNIPLATNGNGVCKSTSTITLEGAANAGLSLAQLKGDELKNDAGMNTMRVWHNVRYDVAPTAALFATDKAWKEKGYKVLSVFVSPPNAPRSLIPTYNQTYAWYQQAYELGKNYVDIWEPGNEPQFGLYWPGTLKEYVDTVQAPAYDALHARGAYIMSAAAAGDINDLKNLINAGILNKTDAVGYHPFGAVTQHIERIRAARALIGTKPLFITEWNIDDHNDSVWAAQIKKAYDGIKGCANGLWYSHAVSSPTIHGYAGMYNKDATFTKHQPFYCGVKAVYSTPCSSQTSANTQGFFKTQTATIINSFGAIADLFRTLFK
jgi:hypothetical protein